MVRKIFNFALMAVLAAGLVGLFPGANSQVVRTPVAIGALPMNGVHLVAPREDKVLRDLQLAGRISKDSTPEQVQLAVEEYRQDFGKKSVSWVNPKVAAAAQAHEEQLAKIEGASLRMADPPVQPVTVTILGLAVQFDNTTTFTGIDCDGNNVTFTGPQAGEMPPPDPGDNATIWYEPAGILDLSVYNKVTFGYDGVGVIRTDLNGGAGVDLSGYTVQDYYDKVSGAVGRVTLDGDFVGWVTVPENEAFYGAPTCDANGNQIDNDSDPVQLVIDAVDAQNVANPTFDWSVYDKDGDQFVDTFWVLHAGAGEEVGGGAQGGFALWSHSSDLRYYAAYPNGYQVDGLDTPADPADDIFIGAYTMNPEMADVGVLSEEFGHNVFGLPDLYTTDVQNSIGFWSIMSAGAYGGPLAGAAPVGMPLWFRMNAWCGVDWCNWQYPMVTRNYKAAAEAITIGTLEDTPVDTVKGVRISLPPVNETIPNEAGAGNGAWSGSGRDQADVILEKSLDVPAGAAGLFSFDSAWQIEDGWDYGYVAVKEGAGAWQYLDDTGTFFTNTNPNGNNLGYGLTGAGGVENLQFDLSAFAGKTITLRLWYKLDAAVNENGWWVDNVMLDGVLVDDFSAATEPGTFPGWTNGDVGWYVVPTFKQYTNYYLLEYRGNTKYDSQVKTAYVTTDSGPNLWTVEHVPYSIPGGLLYYRSTKYPSSYSQLGFYADGPSYGPKNKILVVDMNYERLKIGDTGYSFNNRVGAYDATITNHATEPFTLSTVYGVGGGPYDFASQPAVYHFNDAKGYYAGFEFDGSGLYYSNRDGSAVIPARGLYSTQLRWYDTTIPVYDFFGYGWAPSWLGSGRPGDANVQHGVNVVITDEQETFGTFWFYNYSLDYLISQSSQPDGPEKFLYTYEITVVNTGTETTADPQNFIPGASISPMFEPAELGILLDTKLSLVSVTSGAVVDPAPTAFGYLTGTHLRMPVPSLMAGQSFTVTVKANGPAGAGPHSVWAGFYGWDGQTYRGNYFPGDPGDPRGEWLYESTDTMHNYWVPLVGVGD